MNTTTRYGISILVIHALVGIIHKVAHLNLAIDLSTRQELGVLLIFVLAPIVTLFFLWTNRLRWGFLLLLLTMAASFVFGSVNHFVLITEDHVFHAPRGELRWLFQGTAYLLAVLELMGMAVGLWGVIQLGKLRNRLA
jgi:Ca2+/Na+ antiporter